MGTNESQPPERARRRKPARSERFAAQWAPAIHAELLEAWGARDEGPMPTREDAERVARERTRLLIEGLGEWAEVSPKVLDLNEKAARPGRRGWHRNAWPKRGRHDSDPPWWGFMFDDDEE